MHNTQESQHNPCSCKQLQPSNTDEDLSQHDQTLLDSCCSRGCSSVCQVVHHHLLSWPHAECWQYGPAVRHVRFSMMDHTLSTNRGCHTPGKPAASNMHTSRASIKTGGRCTIQTTLTTTGGQLIYCYLGAWYTYSSPTHLVMS